MMSIANPSETTTYRFTVDQYDRMSNSGVFDDRDVWIELLVGEIVEMPPPNPPHDYVIDLLNYRSVDVTDRDEIWVRIQNSLGISEFDSVPKPDVAWMETRDYRQPVDGRFQNHQAFKCGKVVTPLCQPDVKLSVDTLFGR